MALAVNCPFEIPEPYCWDESFRVVVSIREDLGKKVVPFSEKTGTCLLMAGEP